MNTERTDVVMIGLGVGGEEVAGELAEAGLGALAVAIRGEVPVARLKTMIYAYPTFHRAIEDALRDLDMPGL